MNIDRIRTEILTNDTISYLIAYYETYYQLSYGFYVSYTNAFDVHDSTEIVKKLRPFVDREHITKNIVEALDDANSLEDITRYFRTSSAIKALEDFLQNDKELYGKKLFRDLMLESISNEELFNQQLGGMFSELFPIRYNIWRGFVDEEILRDLNARIDLHNNPLNTEAV